MTTAGTMLGRHATADLCGAHSGVLVMDGSLSALLPGSKLTGRARTARIRPGENAAIHRLVDDGRPGDVLVVCGGDATCGLFGEMIAARCRIREIGGLVVEGAVRDTARLRRMRFPVFSLGANPRAPAKRYPGEVDVPITCAGASVRPGDVIVADDDGIVVVPHEIVSDVGREAQQLVRWENQVRKRIRAGEGMCDIFGID